MMARNHAFVAACLALAAGGPAYAYDDKASGFGIDPPAPFEVGDAAPGTTGLRLGIVSTTGAPPVAGNGKYVCELTYEAAEANASLTQEQINEASQSMWRRDQMSSTVSGQFELGEVNYFSIGPVRGMELVLTPKNGPDAADVRLVLSLAETPKARFVLSCATTAAALESALPQFRSIRDTTRLP